jgi:hypothetical protein
MKRFFLAATAAAFLSCPAFAQDETYDARLTIAKEYVEASMADVDMYSFIQQLWIPVIQQMKNSGIQLSTDQISQIETLYLDTLTEPMLNVMRQQEVLMAELMTIEELTALRDFYNSEHGRAVMQKMPELSQLQQPMIAEMMRAVTPQMLPKIQAIIQGS